MKAVRLLSKTKIPISLLSSQRRHSLKFQRPTTISWQNRPFNSSSVIATVVQPLTAANAAANGNLRAYTFLRVSVSHQSSGGFRILLDMQDEMAEMCFQHLKENDFVYVSGRLVTNTKSDQNENLRIFCKLLVNELNFVTQRRDTTCQEYQELESAEGRAAPLEKWRDRLHLWQVFFSNPYERWDDRNHKLYPGSPDFRHKDTDEALWLSPNDPPWIEKELNLFNSEMGLGEGLGPRAHVSKWECDA